MFTIDEVVVMAAQKCGSRIKLAQQLEQNGCSVTGRTIFNWQDNPDSIRFWQAKILCDIAEVKINRVFRSKEERPLEID